jgi:hypothetical protein
MPFWAHLIEVLLAFGAVVLGAWLVVRLPLFPTGE